MKRTHSFDNGTHLYSTAFGGQMHGTSDLPAFLNEFKHRRIGSSKKELFMAGIKVSTHGHRDDLTFRGKVARVWAQLREANKKAN